MLFNFYWDDQLEAYVISEQNRFKRWLIVGYLTLCSIPYWVIGLFTHSNVHISIKETSDLKQELIDKQKEDQQD